MACSFAAIPAIFFLALWSNALSNVGEALGCGVVLSMPILNLVGMGLGAAGASKSQGRTMALGLLGFTLHLLELCGFVGFAVYAVGHMPKC